MLQLVVAGLTLVLTGCASLSRTEGGQVIEAVDAPLGELRALLVAQLPAGLAFGSPNGRELTSRPFVPGPANTYRAGGDVTQRYLAKFTLLGDRRPYDVEVYVTTERRVLRGGAFRFTTVGTDERLMKELRERIQRELAKRREDRNVVDDFRAY